VIAKTQAKTSNWIANKGKVGPKSKRPPAFSTIQNSNIIFCIVEKAGGLFDFGPTLPLLAIQLLVLACVLAITFLKPLSLRLSERANALEDNKYLIKFYSHVATESAKSATISRKMYLSSVEKYLDEYKKEIEKSVSEVDIWANQSIKTKARFFLSARYNSGATRREFKRGFLKFFSRCLDQI
jgi:hypothetical protein